MKHLAPGRKPVKDWGGVCLESVGTSPCPGNAHPIQPRHPAAPSRPRHPAANVSNATDRAHILLLAMHIAVTPFRQRSRISFHLIRLA